MTVLGAALFNWILAIEAYLYLNKSWWCLPSRWNVYSA